MTESFQFSDIFWWSKGGLKLRLKILRFKVSQTISTNTMENNTQFEAMWNEACKEYMEAAGVNLHRAKT